MGVDSYRLLEHQVFVLRFWREGSGGAWRGQIVHLPDQETTSFASWTQAMAFIDRFVRPSSTGDISEGAGTEPPA